MKILYYLLPILIIAWTIWAVGDYRRLKIALKKGNRGALIREYKVTILGEIIGGLIALGAIGFGIVKPVEGLNLTFGQIGSGLMLGASIGFLISLITVPLAARKGKKQTVGDIDALLPRSAQEKLWYVLVALSAGVCEELVFRGYGLRLLQDLRLSGVILIAISALIFGLAHLYQGIAGILMTAVLGAFLAILYIQTSSLWWAILAHILIDLRVLLLPSSHEASATHS